jgi:hypothetical protein
MGKFAGVELLQTCVWCKQFIEPEQLGTTKVETLSGRTEIKFEHRGKCPD